MRILRIILSILCVLAAVSVSAQQSVNLTERQVLQRYIDAMGGRAGLGNVNSIRIKASVIDESGKEMDLLIVKKRPNMVRTVCDFTLEIPNTTTGRTKTMDVRTIQSYDGNQTWWVKPGKSMEDAQPMPDHLARSLIRDAPFESPLIDAAEKNVELKMRPKMESLNNVYNCYVIEAIYETGTQANYYLDDEEFLERRIEVVETIDGKTKKQVSIPSSYRYFGELPVAMRIVNLDGEDNRTSQIHIEKVDINPGILDTYFKLPYSAQASFTSPEKAKSE